MGIMTSLRGIMKPHSSGSSIGSTKVKAHTQTTPTCQADSMRSSSNISAISTQKPSYRFEHGRRYHDVEDCVYLLPNDDREIDRLHQQHWVLHHAFEGNFSSPVHEQLEEGAVVLDACCGPATWTLDMAKAYDRSEFYGFDICALFPEDIKPANTHLQLANVTQRLPFPDNHFDFIHQRLLILGLTKSDWTKALEELYRVAKPGGWIEFKEPEAYLDNEGPLTNKIHQASTVMLQQYDLNGSISTEMESFLTQLGLENVTSKCVTVPINHSGKVGQLFWENYKEAYLTLNPQMSEFGTAQLTNDFPAYIESCGVECRELKSQWRWHVIYGQKPMLSA
ncbi:S-adenosyl-L-methionine-dependent methyltransferase [Spinellus fusiger]|nr:S-adenosyl-L-methionine-dependent methyltransferase [Spinellus fusiger]